MTRFKVRIKRSHEEEWLVEANSAEGAEAKLRAINLWGGGWGTTIRRCSGWTSGTSGSTWFQSWTLNNELLDVEITTRPELQQRHGGLSLTDFEVYQDRLQVIRIERE